MQYRKLQHDIAQAEKSRYSLCDNGCNGGPCSSQSEDDDQEQIQENIKHRTDNQKIKRQLTVSQRTQDTGQKIIQHLCKDSSADNHNISICILENILRCIHKNQKRFHKCHKYNRQKKSDSQRKDACPRNGLPHSIHIARSEFLCCQNRKSGCRSRDKAPDQKHDRSGASDCCQCFRTDKLSHDHSICHIIKLLKHISDKNRQCKIYNYFHRLSHRHIMLYCFHNTAALLSLSFTLQYATDHFFRYRIALFFFVFNMVLNLGWQKFEAGFIIIYSNFYSEKWR